VVSKQKLKVIVKGIDPPAQVPQRDIIDAAMAFFGTGCIINEQVILQDQEGVLAWVSERLAKKDGQYKLNLNTWENLKAA
jgi:hypothetical protein